MRLYLFLAALVGVGVLIVWFWNREIVKPQRAKIEAAKIAYHQALKDGNRALALELGRHYYSLMRDGNLTIYDEQAITNDLSTIA